MLKYTQIFFQQSQSIDNIQEQQQNVNSPNAGISDQSIISERAVNNFVRVSVDTDSTSHEVT